MEGNSSRVLLEHLSGLNLRRRRSKELGPISRCRRGDEGGGGKRGGGKASDAKDLCEPNRDYNGPANVVSPPQEDWGWREFLGKRPKEKKRGGSAGAEKRGNKGFGKAIDTGQKRKGGERNSLNQAICWGHMRREGTTSTDFTVPGLREKNKEVLFLPKKGRN